MKKELYKLTIRLCLTLLFAVFIMTGCKAKDQGEIPVINTQVSGKNEFGSAILAISADTLFESGYAFGDTVDVRLENGQEFPDIPFFDGYYSKPGERQLVVYKGGDPLLATNFGAFYEEAGLSDGMKVEISMHEKGKAAVTQEICALNFSNNRDDFASDEIFANAREVTVGKIRSGTLYRSASPFDPINKRAQYASEFAKDHKIKTVLDLSDDEEKIEEYETLPEYSKELLEADGVILNKMTIDYSSEEFEEKLAEGLIKMSKMEGPYLVHCVEGKDRTGYVCILLEALCRALPEEIVDDYMVTYDNYFGITKEDKERYGFIRDMYFMPLYSNITGGDNMDMTGEELGVKAEEYLKGIGLEDEDIERLKKCLM